MTDEERKAALDRSLTNQPPTDAQIDRIEKVRDVAKIFGAIIIHNVHDTRERSLALTHLEETTMWAVKGIVLE